MSGQQVEHEFRVWAQKPEMTPHSHAQCCLYRSGWHAAYRQVTEGRGSNKHVVSILTFVILCIFQLLELLKTNMHYF